MKALTMERLMRLSVAVLALVCAPSLLAEARIATNGPSPATNAVEGVNWTAGVAYSYDGSGNIRQIGNDRFVYDQVGRLTQAEVNGVVRTYTYDAFGNRTNCLHGPGTAIESNCQYGMTVDAETNRVDGVEYDRAGNVETFSGHHYSYDAVNMVTADDRGNGLEKEFIYTADDERIATYTVGSTWHWTIREMSGKVLREFSSDDTGSSGLGTGSWRLVKDYVWRDGLLLASRHVVDGVPVTYHYHLDHLGTPRRVTDHTDRIVGFHDYYAFGPEVSGGLTEPSPTSLQYTGHERDKWGGGEGLDTLDYMHARYNSPALGRFLSVDPVLGDPEEPQSWNRYSYVSNNPMNFTDPTGMCGEAADFIGPTLPCDIDFAEEIDVTADAPGIIESIEFIAEETTAQITPFGPVPGSAEGLWSAYQDRQFLKANPDWKPDILTGTVTLGPGFRISNLRYLQGGRLLRGNVTQSGGVSAARAQFERLTGRPPVGAADSAKLADGTVVKFRAVGRSGGAKVEINDPRNGTYQKTTFND